MSPARTSTLASLRGSIERIEAALSDAHALNKIALGHAGADATVFPEAKGEARVRLHKPQRAVTPGQAAVCYRGDEVLGGGWIVRQDVAKEASLVES